MEEIFLTEQSEKEVESEKPPSTNPRPARSWRVAVLANIKGEVALLKNGPADAGAEFDRKETIQAIRSAIESDGHSTKFFPADSNLPYALKSYRPSICFNLAEGLGGDAREAQVPALLEMLGIPYTASRVLANALALDKAMTKRVWRENRLPTASFQEFVTGHEAVDTSLKFPMFVKPAREGTGMGMDNRSIVNNQKELRERIAWVVENYHQPALVEEYLPGREFTVAVLGRLEAAKFSTQPALYGSDGFHRFPILEVDNSNSVTPGVYGIHAKTLHFGDEGIPGFVCPAKLNVKLEQQLQTLAIRGHKAIGAVDISRIDFRLDIDGQPRLIEINSLPGLTPGFSDLCIIAEAEGMTYRDLIVEILHLGASRFGLVQPRTIPVKQPARVPYKHIEVQPVFAR